MSAYVLSDGFQGFACFLQCIVYCNHGMEWHKLMQQLALDELSPKPDPYELRAPQGCKGQV